ncbi:hypothetical protein COW36_21475 [bacterium (Candidatus Blackallbacteria) CG17_big_fil_post_rev_8_21_14_2_50_48_46]|uniref:VOC domain-containing protein n=1 Tax=bacterium (Candidatus Blackallbacteria) CG17_big_fil_post_rev_8_21_14_2_50_48_46 TaxID=2014261 RepID=A0A2M7FZ09_9BACT|nr:MAG: hypothetical protein COW64_14775 [bacterium (Candidatus Blackallbacteria) CG18_big_fil_WC_8_21_14_2_50_49_26]PIW14610.1 MAG: hypothetical protein COW36_21475 [bacterium (Candidatus Blackallbacteria) CG17_big_fil_post_rev_8_21_14_2_50_48_46]PIW45661.1 MAG: hypothetical protein COW20_19305 [bacterium (Candidatus Blackallbacteria) CG13_big_fil_rev_8_21_14_2_50_49_14]
MSQHESRHPIHATEVLDISTVLCTSIDTIRYFYGYLLGLEEKISKDKTYVVFQLGQTEIMFCQSQNTTVQGTAKHDYLDIPSLWSIPVPEALYLGLLYRLKHTEVVKLERKPSWHLEGYWSVSLIDPAGNPVELYTVPQEVPQNKEWESFSLSALA